MNIVSQVGLNCFCMAKIHVSNLV